MAWRTRDHKKLDRLPRFVSCLMLSCRFNDNRMSRRNPDRRRPCVHRQFAPQYVEKLPGFAMVMHDLGCAWGHALLEYVNIGALQKKPAVAFLSPDVMLSCGCRDQLQRILFYHGCNSWQSIYTMKSPAGWIAEPAEVRFTHALADLAVQPALQITSQRLVSSSTRRSRENAEFVSVFGINRREGTRWHRALEKNLRYVALLKVPKTLRGSFPLRSNKPRKTPPSAVLSESCAGPYRPLYCIENGRGGKRLVSRQSCRATKLASLRLPG